MGISDYQILQRDERGFGRFEFLSETYEWVKNPVTKAEKEYASDFMKTLKMRIFEEDTGRDVTFNCKLTLLDNLDIHVEVTDIPTGGLYTIARIYDFGNHGMFVPDIIARHVGVGDVFIALGQSNAEGVGYGIVSEPAEVGVHTVYKGGHWDIASNPLSFSDNRNSPFMTFAKVMHKRLNYPIGIISRAVGGSSVSQWVAGGNLLESVRTEFAEREIRAKAVLWYQGCNEASENRIEGYYKEKFSEFASEIRTILGDEDLPIYTFQLNREKAGASDVGYSHMREMQRKMREFVKNTYVIPTIDSLMMSDQIHNSRYANVMLGERLSGYVLRYTYGMSDFPIAPELSEARKISDDEIVLKFSDVSDSVSVAYCNPCELPVRLVDDNGVAEVKSYVCRNDTLTVKFTRNISGEAKVSLMWGANPRGHIFETRYLLPVVCITDAEVK